MSAKIDPFKSVTVRSYTAKRFLQNLDETHERWGSDRGAIDWIFRGQNDATWELMPSLFRPWHKDVKHWNEDTFASYEISLIDGFINNANLMNLPIPNNSLDHIIDNKRNTKKWLGNDEIGYDFSHVVFAIARHSGIPTRLLDFTHNPLVAAYFAADVTQLYEDLGYSPENKAKYIDKCIDLVEDNKGNVDDSIVEIVRSYINELNVNAAKLPQDIAVWAIRYNDLRETTIRLLEHPYAEILNLRLQKGVFLCDTKSYETEGNLRQSLNAELTKLVESKGIYKFTLPFSQRPALFYLLRKKRMVSTYLTPSYEKIAEVVLNIVKKL